MSLGGPRTPFWTDHEIRTSRRELISINGSTQTAAHMSSDSRMGVESPSPMVTGFRETFRAEDFPLCVCFEGKLRQSCCGPCGKMQMIGARMHERAASGGPNDPGVDHQSIKQNSTSTSTIQGTRDSGVATATRPPCLALFHILLAARCPSPWNPDKDG
jgi:hypothetical protein